MDPKAEDFRDRVSSWGDLAELIEHFSYFTKHDWLFRGVTDVGHGLVPRIGREQTRALKVDSRTHQRDRVPYRIEDERAVFAMFRQQARPYLPSAPRTPLEWLAIAQHFGLPTRLLDWTDSLLAAAWFAVEKSGAKKVDSAIWVTRGIVRIEIDDPTDPFALAEPRIYRPPHISPRISAQGSVLLVCPKPTEELTLPFSRRITIDHSKEFLIRKRLNACGINRRHLFPDLGGLVEHLAWLHKQDWLAGYTPRSDLEPSPTPEDTPDEGPD